MLRFLPTYIQVPRFCNKYSTWNNINVFDNPYVLLPQIGMQ